jgi:hypothetical protein
LPLRACCGCCPRCPTPRYIHTTWRHKSWLQISNRSSKPIMSATVFIRVRDRALQRWSRARNHHRCRKTGFSSMRGSHSIPGDVRIFTGYIQIRRSRSRSFRSVATVSRAATMSTRHLERLTTRWSERPPATRLRFASLVRLHSDLRSLSVAVAHLILVRCLRAASS